jgi:hypothetical protein
MLCFRAKPGPGLSHPLGLRTRTRLKFATASAQGRLGPALSCAFTHTCAARDNSTCKLGFASLTSPDLPRHGHNVLGKLSLPVSSLDLPSWVRGVLMGTVGQG